MLPPKAHSQLASYFDNELAHRSGATPPRGGGNWYGYPSYAGVYGAPSMIASDYSPYAQAPPDADSKMESAAQEAAEGSGGDMTGAAGTGAAATESGAGASV